MKVFMKNTLTIQNFRSSIENKEILKGINLEIKSGEVHAVMGPNGAGKTTLAMSLMGHTGYKADASSQFTINKKSLIQITPEERARMGLFISFQQPVEVTGVSVLSFLRTAQKALYPDKKQSLPEFKKDVKDAFEKIG